MKKIILLLLVGLALQSCMFLNDLEYRLVGTWVYENNTLNPTETIILKFEEDNRFSRTVINRSSGLVTYTDYGEYSTFGDTLYLDFDHYTRWEYIAELRSYAGELILDGYEDGIGYVSRRYLSSY